MMLSHPPTQSQFKFSERGRCAHMGQSAKSQFLIILKPLEQATLIWKCYELEVTTYLCFVMVGCPLGNLFKFRLIATSKVRVFQMKCQAIHAKWTCISPWKHCWPALYKQRIVSVTICSGCYNKSTSSLKKLFFSHGLKIGKTKIKVLAHPVSGESLLNRHLPGSLVSSFLL